MLPTLTLMMLLAHAAPPPGSAALDEIETVQPVMERASKVPGAAPRVSRGLRQLGGMAVATVIWDLSLSIGLAALTLMAGATASYLGLVLLVDSPVGQDGLKALGGLALGALVLSIPATLVGIVAGILATLVTAAVARDGMRSDGTPLCGVLWGATALFDVLLSGALALWWVVSFFLTLGLCMGAGLGENPEVQIAFLLTGGPVLSSVLLLSLAALGGVGVLASWFSNAGSDGAEPSAKR